MKQELIAIIIALAIMIGGPVGATYHLAMPFSGQETREIWTPEQFHIANILSGYYMSVSEYENEEATQMSFTELRKDYDSSYSNESFEIIVQQNGTVWYVWSFHGVPFKAPHQYNLRDSLHDDTVTNVLRDGQKAYITIVFFISVPGCILLFIVYLVLFFGGLFFGWLFYPKSKNS